MIALDFEKVPRWYPLCSNVNCQLRDKCMHHKVFQEAPKGLGVRPFVMPDEADDNLCRFFSEVRTVTMARGFKHLFDRVLKKDYTLMRLSLTAFFHGKRQYYWYLRGERPLSPEQQEWMNQWLHMHGYDWDVPFDSFEDTYVFDRTNV